MIANSDGIFNSVLEKTMGGLTSTDSVTYSINKLDFIYLQKDQFKKLCQDWKQ